MIFEFSGPLQRISRFLNEKGLSRSYRKRCFKEGKILLNGEAVMDSSRFIKQGDRIQIGDVERNADFDVLHDDEHVAVIVKPAGIQALQSSTLMDSQIRFSDCYKQLSTSEFSIPHLVVFPPKGLSGLVLLAKSEIGTTVKSSVKQTWHVLVHGEISKECSIEIPITETGEMNPASTLIKPLKVTLSNSSGHITTIQATALVGGYRHQIPIHLQSIRHPVIGDITHAQTLPSQKCRNAFLSLTTIEFIHPVTGQQFTYSIPEPAKFEQARQREEMFWLKKQKQVNQSASLYSEDIDSVEQVLNRSIPLAYAVGCEQFLGRRFNVNQHVMVPRKSSEVLVRRAINQLKDKTKPRVLDMGTGSGCLLISILAEYPNASGIGMDICENALEMAEKNAEMLNVFNRCKFVKYKFSEMSNLVKEGPFDVIICNPPYLPLKIKREIGSTMDIRSNFNTEPNIALYANDAKGLEYYHEISREIQKLQQESVDMFDVLIFEIRHGSSQAVISIFKKLGLQHELVRDGYGLERCLIFKKNPLQ